MEMNNIKFTTLLFMMNAVTSADLNWHHFWVADIVGGRNILKKVR
jgi:hypothetical protein